LNRVVGGVVVGVVTLSIAGACGGSSPSKPSALATPTASAVVTAPASATAPPTTVPTTPVPVATTAPSSSLHLGETGTATGPYSDSGSATVTVYSVTYPVDGSGVAREIRSPGMTFAVADMKVCPTSSEGDIVGGFHLYDSDSSDYQFWNVQVGARDPNLVKALSPAVAGKCSRGFMTFQVPPGKKLSSLTYAANSDGSGTSVTWSLDGQ
jgi:hypothetical protein